jgi:hypothetical protein
MKMSRHTFEYCDSGTYCDVDGQSCDDGNGNITVNITMSCY